MRPAPGARCSASASARSCSRARSVRGSTRRSAPEVGLLEVELTEEGRADPLFAGIDEPLVSLQWHADTFDLPDGAVRLARSPAIANQAFRAGETAYGVQFHLEVTAEMAREWATIPAYRASLDSTLGEREGEVFVRRGGAPRRRAPSTGANADRELARARRSGEIGCL